jgi:hypothetical protein
MTDPTPRSRGSTATVRRSTVEIAAGDRMAELEARLARLERAPTLRQRGRSMMDRVMPPEASEHFRNAGREQLLGVRSIVDYWISRLDEADTEADRRDRRREQIEIE